MHGAWVSAVERLGQFRWESALRSWLSGFVINGARQWWREAQREAAAVDAHHPTTDLPLLETANRVDLERAIAALPAGFREVLVLHDVEGYTHEEIAAFLGIVPGTSKSQLARARQALREALCDGKAG